MEKKVYILFEESNWFGQEPYSDVVDVFESEEDAINALTEQKWDFLEKHEEKFQEDILKDENYTLTDERKHFQCLDEGMGNNYELWVFERTLVPKKRARDENQTTL